MRKLSGLFLVFLSIGTSQAEDSPCESKRLVLDETRMHNFAGSPWWTLPLPAWVLDGEKKYSGAVVDFATVKASYLDLNFRFDVPEDMVNNPYRILRVEFDVGEGADIVHVERGWCNSYIGEFTPGNALRADPIYILPHADGSERGWEKIHIKIWGEM